MEHTVIGSMVNLAARLCSAANAGEVVMTSDFTRSAPALGLELPELEEISAKGFTDPVPCLRIAVVTEDKKEEEE
jgi:adenylate cyclase